MPQLPGPSPAKTRAPVADLLLTRGSRNMCLLSCSSKCTCGRTAACGSRMHRVVLVIEQSNCSFKRHSRCPAFQAWPRGCILLVSRGKNSVYI